MYTNTPAEVMLSKDYKGCIHLEVKKISSRKSLCLKCKTMTDNKFLKKLHDEHRVQGDS